MQLFALTTLALCVLSVSKIKKIDGYDCRELRAQNLEMALQVNPDMYPSDAIKTYLSGSFFGLYSWTMMHHMVQVTKGRPQDMPLDAISNLPPMVLYMNFKCDAPGEIQELERVLSSTKVKKTRNRIRQKIEKLQNNTMEKRLEEVRDDIEVKLLGEDCAIIQFKFSASDRDRIEKCMKKICECGSVAFDILAYRCTLRWNFTVPFWGNVM